jgi:pyruvate-formate lyase
MSSHLIFGKLSGAAPNGRRSGRPLPPGIGPAADAGADLPSSMQAASRLDPEKMPNNISFGLKISPDSGGSPEEIVGRLASRARSYFERGGMELELTLVSREALEDALRSPGRHRNLLVRISGNCAYFVDLSPDLQLEIIDRKEFKV